MPTWDKKITDVNIATTHPLIRLDVEDIINTLEKLGRKVRVTFGLRTFEQQNAMYEVGRTKPGRIITKAKGGQSWHNYGLAVDVVEVQPMYGYSTHGNYPDKRWEFVADIFKNYGFEWGIKFGDRPHFQKTFGLTIQEAQKKLSNNDTDAPGYIIIDSTIDTIH